MSAASKPHNRPLEFAAIDDPTVAWTSRTFENSEWVREENFAGLVESYERLFEQLETAREALEHIANGDMPNGLPSWVTGKSWRIELAQQTLASFPARES